MRLLELFGTIKLSYRQAEGRRFAIAVLCLKYIASLAAAAAAFWLFAASDQGRADVALAFCAVAAALIAVLLAAVIGRAAARVRNCHTVLRTPITLKTKILA